MGKPASGPPDLAVAPQPSASTSASATKPEKKRAVDAPVQHHLTLDELLDQLPLVSDGLYSLGNIVHRVVGQVYSQLEGLTDILPSKDDYERKHLIVKFVQDARKRLVRLLVVTRWSAQARYVKRVQDVLAFLQMQEHYLTGTGQSLGDMRFDLLGARLRNFDISTAIDVLTTGSFHGAPSMIEQQYAGPLRLPTEVVHSTLTQLDDLLRYRLAVEDHVPVPMRQYRIGDGKAYVTVPSLFKTCLTLNGDTDHDSWRCLDIEFLPECPPLGMQARLYLLAQANEELVSTPATDPGEPDRPLQRLYALFRDISLDLRLERLAAEASRLALAEWRDSLTVEFARDGRSLTVSYWVNAITQTSAPRQLAGAHRPPVATPPRLVIFVAQRRPTLAELIATRPDDIPDLDVELHYKWNPSDSPTEAERPSKPLQADDSIASLLDTISRTHMDTLCRHVYLTVRSHTMPALTDVTSTPLLRDEQMYGFRHGVHHSFDLDVLLDQHSGRFHLRPLEELSSGLVKYINGLESDINGSRDRFSAALAQISALASTEDIELQASLAGLRIVRVSSLRPEDQQKLGVTHHALLMLPVHPCPPYYLLALAPPNSGLRFAIASMLPPNDQIPAWSVSDLAWIVTPDTPILSKVSVERLLGYHRYAAIRVAYLQLEQQLAARLIPYNRFGTKKASKANLLDTIPVLYIRLDDLLPGAHFAHRNIAIRVDYVSPKRSCEVIFYLRLGRTARHLCSASDLPDFCQVDMTARLVTARFAAETTSTGEEPLAAFLDVLGTLLRKSGASSPAKKT